MEIKLGKCYHKNGQEMEPDYKPQSIPELEELLTVVYSRIEHTGNKQDSDSA